MTNMLSAEECEALLVGLDGVIAHNRCAYEAKALGLQPELTDDAMVMRDTIRLVLGRGPGPLLAVGPADTDLITLADLL